jgi:hypothetical protein
VIARRSIREQDHIVAHASGGTMSEHDADYTYHLAVGSHALAQRLTQLEDDARRKERKRRVLEKKAELLVDTYPQLKGLESAHFSALPARLGRHEDANTRRTLLIDLAFCDPFAPYQLKFKTSDLDLALESVASTLGLPKAAVAAIRATQRAAVRAHVANKAARVAAVGAGAAAVVGVAAWWAAPAIGAARVGYAGLSGAAATSAGLALLGGGSLAAGGFGVAGGMAVVTGIGAAAGFGGVSGAMVMMEIGAARSRAELVKLQVTYKEVLLRNQADAAKAQLVVRDLARQHEELGAQLDEERTLNDANATRLKELKQTVEAVERSLAWMKKQRAA